MVEELPGGDQAVSVLLDEGPHGAKEGVVAQRRADGVDELGALVEDGVEVAVAALPVAAVDEAGRPGSHPAIDIAPRALVLPDPHQVARAPVREALVQPRL